MSRVLASRSSNTRRSSSSRRPPSSTPGAKPPTSLATDAKEFAAERRTEIDATLKRMQADAATAEEKLKKLNEAGVQSWSALMAALTETRTAFDRANQAAREAFKRVA